MTEQPQAQASGLMPIGAVAAHNIAALLNLSQEHVGTIEQAIKDEINAMSSHFTLAVADVQTQYEAETQNLKKQYDASVAEIKSEFNFVKANGPAVAGVLTVALLIGGVIGHLI